jgi:hypothetical protein
VALGDFTGNHNLDIVTANESPSNSVSVLLNNGDGTFRAPVNYPVGSQPAQVVVGNFTGHGKRDLATANTDSNTVSILLGNGNGTFQPALSIPVGKNPRALAVGDLSGDGFDDLVVACTDSYQTHSVDVLLGNGDGTFRLSQRLTGFGFVGGPQSVAIGDFNGDGKLDFVTADAGYTVSRFLGNGDGTFLPRVSYSAGHRTATIATGDFNGDGILDLVVSGDTYGSVTLLKGNGNGTFQTAVGLPNDFGGSFNVAVADVNGDGKDDLVILNNDGDTLGVRLGNGDFTFQSPRTYRVGPGPGAGALSLAVGDVHGDGYPDIVVADRNFDYVAVLRNQPNAARLQVNAPSTSVAGTEFDVTVTAVDAVGDAVPSYRGTVHFTSTDSSADLPGDYTFTPDDHGTHTFRVTLRTAGSRTITVADLEADSIMGNATVAVSPAAASSFLVSDFPSPSTAGVAGSVTVTAEDRYGNIATGYRGSVRLSSSDSQATLPGTYAFNSNDNGTHSFNVTLKTAGSQSITATDVAAASLTGSQTDILVVPAATSKLDIAAPASIAPGVPFDLTVTARDPFNNVATGYRGEIHFTNSDPRGTLPNNYTFTEDDAGVHTFTMVLPSAGNQSVSVRDTANGSLSKSVSLAVIIPPIFGSPVSLNAGGGPRSVAVGDFNGDGKLDVVVANAGSNNLSIMFGLGDGTFLNAINIPSGGRTPTQVVVGDFNHDGKADLIVVNQDSNAISVLLGNGNGTFKDPVNYSVGLSPVSLAVGDFDGDGTEDLAVANYNSNNVSVLLGDGTGKFQLAANYAVDVNPFGIAVGDLTGDGNLDIITANDGLSFSVLLGRGDGTFAPAVNQSAGGARPRSVAVADLNGDGHLDLVTANYGSGTVSVYFGRGDGTFLTPVNYPTQVGFSLLPIMVLLADVDGDGHLDIVTANQRGSVSVLLGFGDGTFQPALNYRAGSIPFAVAVGDFNGDGAPDLVVANNASNDVSVLLNLAPAVCFSIDAPSDGTAGTEFTITATARNAFGGIATGYRGTLHFTSSDGDAVLPDDYPFTADDKGVHTFTVMLRGLGDQTITVRDTADGTLLASVIVTVGESGGGGGSGSGGGGGGLAPDMEEDSWNFRTDSRSFIVTRNIATSFTLPAEAQPLVWLSQPAIPTVAVARKPQVAVRTELLDSLFSDINNSFIVDPLLLL